MINPELLKYIKTELANGLKKEVIQTNLLSNDWNKVDIEEAFVFIETGVSAPNPLLKDDLKFIEKNHSNISVVGSIIICFIWYMILKVNIANTQDIIDIEVISFMLTVPFLWIFSLKFINNTLKPKNTIEGKVKDLKHNIPHIIFFLILLIPLIVFIIAIVKEELGANI